MARIVPLLALLLLAGCSAADFPQQGRPPSYRHSLTNGTDAAGFVPPNSLPP